MRLKKLTLFGFKSFPNRTKIEFSKGICAIVGPNGCGKSNVVDAIRWVLGEQSAKMLRARSMDDVIFSGSNGRNVSFAEVSLVLENTGNMAPPEFEDLPEIEIKRMVTRKGDTRYLLNGKNCRLKDIHYLLMDTGAGTRAYSIVDQGQVGQFVEMSPQERRHIIEEVAGISRYKARRVEAERRMADTTRNLERLNDLMSEVDRQLKSASRQAKKTERYLELRGEEELLDRALLRYAWDEQVERLDVLEKEMDRAREVLAASEAGLASVLDQREGVKSGLVELEDELRKLKSGLSGAEELLERLRQERAAAEKELYRIKVRLQSVEENAVESSRREQGTRRRHAEVTAALGRLYQEEKDLRTEAEEAKRQVDDALLHVEQVKAELEEVKVQLVDAAAEQARLDSERRALRERGKRLESRIERREEEAQRFRKEHEGLEDKKRELTVTVQELQESLSRIVSRRDEVSGELARVRAELEQARSSGKEVEARLASLAARLDALKAVEASGQGIPDEVNEFLGKHEGVLGLLADFIEVDRGWEQVFETALGSRLHALVVQGKDTCASIAKAFGHKASGRLNMVVASGLISKEDGSSSVPLISLAGDGQPDGCLDEDPLPVAEPLMRHVKVAPFLKDSVSAFVAGAFRVESLEAGMRLFEAGDVAYLKAVREPMLVTPGGETIRPWLEVGVQGDGDGSSGILVRKAMIRDLEEEVATTREELAAIMNRVKALSEAESRASRELSELDSRASKMEKERAARVRELESTEMKLESLSSRLQVMEFEIKEAREELLDVEFTLEERETALEECSKRNQELSSALKGREGALRQQEGVLERRRGHYQEIRIRLTRIESNIREREKEKKRLERQQERIRSDASNFEQEKRALEKRIATQEDVLSAASARVEAQEKAVSDARSRAASLEQDRDAVLQRLSEVEERLSEQEKVVREAEKRVHGLEIDLSEARQALEFVGLSSLERHQISAAAITGVDDILDSMDVDEIKRRLDVLRDKIGRMGAVNLQALDEYNELKERWDFLDTQKQDLEKSMADLRQAIDKINRTCRSRFREALDAVNSSLEQVFPLLFDGGSARLQLDSREDVLEAGVEYLVNLPGKRIQHLNLLSGGEKTMAAMALLFAVYFIKPSPFCLLDEVDAPLDEANTLRFNRLIRKIAKESQVVIITHNQRVMDTADTLYGVTMEDRGVSKVVSVNLVGA